MPWPTAGGWWPALRPAKSPNGSALARERQALRSGPCAGLIVLEREKGPTSRLARLGVGGPAKSPDEMTCWTVPPRLPLIIEIIP